MTLRAYQKTQATTEGPRNTEYRLFGQVTGALLDAKSKGAVGTPLVEAPHLSELTGCRVYLKVEGANPTGSFKDRGMTVAMTQAMVFSADDGCDVGEDSGAPVSPDYGSRGNAFNGTVKGVQLAIAEAAESDSHLVTPEDAIRIAMARQ